MFTRAGRGVCDGRDGPHTTAHTGVCTAAPSAGLCSLPEEKNHWSSAVSPATRLLWNPLQPSLFPRGSGKKFCKFKRASFEKPRPLNHAMYLLGDMIHRGLCCGIEKRKEAQWWATHWSESPSAFSVVERPPGNSMWTALHLDLLTAQWLLGRSSRQLRSGISLGGGCFMDFGCFRSLRFPRRLARCTVRLGVCSRAFLSFVLFLLHWARFLGRDLCQMSTFLACFKFQYRSLVP